MSGTVARALTPGVAHGEELPHELRSFRSQQPQPTAEVATAVTVQDDPTGGAEEAGVTEGDIGR